MPTSIAWKFTCLLYKGASEVAILSLHPDSILTHTETGGVQGSGGSCDYLLLYNVTQSQRTHSLAVTKLVDTHSDTIVRHTQ